MKDLRFSQIDPYHNFDLDKDKHTKFNIIRLTMNQQYAGEDQMKMQIIYLIKGELLLTNKKQEAVNIHEGEFFFTRNVNYACHALRESNFVVFEVERNECVTNPNIQREMMAVTVCLRDIQTPCQAPPVLSLFFENIADFMDRGIDDPLLRQIKRKELFLLLTSLYPGNGMGELLMYNQFSLS